MSWGANGPSLVEVSVMENPNLKESAGTPEDPGLLESHGSFPVWLLKIIHLLTPDFLISKTPPKKKKLRI